MNFLIECPICKKLLEQPVILACNHTICKNHVNDIGAKESETINCPICQVDHKKTDKEFPPNLLAESLIKFHFDELDLGPEYKVATESVKYIKNLLEKYKRIRDDPELEIDRVFEDLKNKIDLRREEMKMKIDQEGLEFIERLEDAKNECKSTQNEKIKCLSSIEAKEFIKSLENEINLFENELATFKRNAKKWETLHEDLILKYERLKEEYEKINPLGESYPIIELQVKKFCDEKIHSLM